MLGTSFGIGLAFGPLMAGTLIEYFGWRSLFITTGAIAAVAFMFGVPRMRESRDPNAAGLDYPGTITFSATLVLFTTAIIQAPESGWGSPLIVGLLAASVVTLVAFIMVEIHARRPDARPEPLQICALHRCADTATRHLLQLYLAGGHAAATAHRR